MKMQLPPLCPFAKGADRLFRGRAIAILLAALALLLAIAASCLGWQGIKKWIAVAWIMGPAAWFLIEFQLYTSIDDSVSKQKLEEFSYGQELAAKVWAAVAALIFFAWYQR